MNEANRICGLESCHSWGSYKAMFMSVDKLLKHLGLGRPWGQAEDLKNNGRGGTLYPEEMIFITKLQFICLIMIFSSKTPHRWHTSTGWNSLRLLQKPMLMLRQLSSSWERPSWRRRGWGWLTMRWGWRVSNAWMGLTEESSLCVSTAPEHYSQSKFNILWGTLQKSRCGLSGLL